MSIAMNPNTFFLRQDPGAARNVHVEKLMLDPYTKAERWVVLAKCADREKAEQLAVDGFGGGEDVRVVDAA